MLDLHNKPIPAVNITLPEENARTWDIAIQGLDSTVFKHGILNLRIDFDDHYPYKIPKIKFLTKMQQAGGAQSSVLDEVDFIAHPIMQIWNSNHTARFFIESIV